MKIRRTEDIAWRRIDREMVVVHLTRHRMCALNEHGAELWEEMESPLEGDRLTQLLGNPNATLFLADLVSEGLVESDSPIPVFSAVTPEGNDRESPRIEWREEVRRFAGDCGLIFGQSLLCSQNPTNS